MTYTLEQTEEMVSALRALPAMDSSKRRLTKQAVVKLRIPADVITWIGPVITSGVGQARRSLKTTNRQPISPLRGVSTPDHVADLGDQRFPI